MRPSSPAFARGFTLFELLIAILLIGLVSSFAVLGVQGKSPAERQREEAGRLLARMELAREEAVLNARSVGIRVDRDGYRFLEFVDQQWQPLTDRRGFTPHAIPETMGFEVDVEGQDIVLGSAGTAGDEEADDSDGGVGEDGQPQIYFLAGGEIIPAFTIRLISDETLIEYRVHPGDEQWLALSRDEL